MDKQGAFAIGAQAAANAGNCSPRYVCPICLASFFNYDPTQLTEEHVPAAALGGKGLVLTCIRCNSTAGSLLQGHQSSRHKYEKFWSTDTTQLMNIELETAYGTLRGQGKISSDNNVEMTIHRHRMDPKVLENCAENLSNISYKNMLVGRPFDNEKARIADLRDAYLWTFARWGYSAVALPAFDWVRDAIQKGKTTRDKWSILMGEDPTKDWLNKCGRPVICFLNRPNGAMLICNGRSGIILPTIFNTNPYAELDAEKANLEIAPHFECVPLFMQMGMDFSGFSKSA